MGSLSLACPLSQSGSPQEQEVTWRSGEVMPHHTSAGPGYLSLRQPWAAGQPPPEACLHLGPAWGDWETERTGGLRRQACGPTGPTWGWAWPCPVTAAPVELRRLGAVILWLWAPPSLRAWQSVSIFPPYWFWAPPSLKTGSQLTYSLLIGCGRHHLCDCVRVN